MIHSNTESKPSKPLVIFLHGYGACGDNLMACEDILKKSNPSLEVWFPDGHDIWEGCEVGSLQESKARQWFSLKGIDFSTLSKTSVDLQETAMLYRHLEDASLKLVHRITERFPFAIKKDPIFLAGFSQGAALACHCALYHLRCAGLIIFSGFYRVLHAPRFPCPTFLYHGGQDPVVPVALAHQTQQDLSAYDIPIQDDFEPYTSHTISFSALEKAGAFMQSICRSQS